MKTATSYFKVLTLILFTTLAMAACSNKSENNNRVSGREAGNGQSVAPTANSTCSNTNMEWGKVYDSQNSNLFEGQVKGFVSATLDPNSLGRIDGGINSKTGIDLYAGFDFDDAGQIVPENSKFKMRIFDDAVGQTYNGTVIPPYVVEFSTATEGFLDRATGNLQVTFQDEFGTITFRGRQVNDRVNGTIDYVNKVVVGSGPVASGKLGDFVTYACSTIK